MVERPSRMSGSGREIHPEVREWSGGPPGGPEGVGSTFRRPGSVREALPEVRIWSGVVRTPFQRTGSGREALPKVRE